MAQPFVQGPVLTPAALEQMVLWIVWMRGASEALVGVEGGHFGQPGIVVHADMCIRRNLLLLFIFKLVGETQEVGVGVAFKYIHP